MTPETTRSSHGLKGCSMQWVQRQRRNSRQAL